MYFSCEYNIHYSVKNSYLTDYILDSCSCSAGQKISAFYGHIKCSKEPHTVHCPQLGESRPQPHKPILCLLLSIRSNLLKHRHQSTYILLYGEAHERDTAVHTSQAALQQAAPSTPVNELQKPVFKFSLK
jgi:hypothetical protein